MDEDRSDHPIAPAAQDGGAAETPIRPRWRFAPLGRGRALLEAAAFWRLRLAAVFEREIDAGRGFLWLPVAFGLGILVYFALPAEPWAPAIAGILLALTVAAWRARLRTAAFRILIVASLAAAGLLAAKVRTDQVAAPMLTREMTVTVTGWIAAREEASRGGVRIHLRVHAIADLRGADAGNRARHRAQPRRLACGRRCDQPAGAPPATQRTGHAGRL